MLCKQSSGRYKMQRFDCILGQALNQSQISRTGIYGVVSTMNGIILRLPVIKELADMYRDSSREIVEVFLVPV